LAYYNRGLSKDYLQDYRGAIADYSKAIELDPNYSDAYYNRGLSKLKLNQKNSACLDWSKAGELGDGDAYDLIKEHCN
jgi:tetratricopeptide (TPR) repeat protein